MKLLCLIVSIFLLVLSPVDLIAFGEEKIQLPPKENFHVYLLAGQSNMAGRGKVTAADNQTHPQILVLNKKGQWELARDPLHFDKSGAGVGPGKSFALALVEQNPEITIGLIPAACGGSPISKWVPGGYHKQTKSYPYDEAIKRTNIALEHGVLKGILWHQGESDSKVDKAKIYEQNLNTLIVRFRETFDEPNLPILIGQLGQFERKPWDRNRKLVDEAHQSVATQLEGIEFVPSNGLNCKNDGVHFDATSMKEFGRRYAQVLLSMSPPQLLARKRRIRKRAKRRAKLKNKTGDSRVSVIGLL